MKLTVEQIKAMADRAEARARGKTDEQTKASEFVDDAVLEGLIDAEVEQLALLSPTIYETRRDGCARRLHVRVSYLDKRVSAKRKEDKKTANGSAAVKTGLGELQRSHIIKHPDILGLFAKEIAKVIAGEEANGRLLYLIGTSRVFDKPMNAVIKGTSAGGKSEIRKRILEFFPPEDVVSFTSLSEKSLIYYEGDFSHKILSMGEATATDEQDFQDYLLRELMSEGRIRHSTVQKIGNDLQAITIEKHGPVAFMVTTTKNQLHPENETRMLSLEVDDTENQTKNVLDKVAQVDGLHDTAPVDYRSWQDFQRWLAAGECRVLVPFALEMAKLIPAVAVRLRRDFGQVIYAIKVHALLHRDQRGRDDAGRIVADIDHDYAVIRELMNPIVAESCGVAVNPATTATINAVVKATANMDTKEGASAKDIGVLLQLDRSAAWRRLQAACDAGYVVNLEQRKGMAGKYQATGQKVEPVALLPAADALARAFCPASKTDEPCNRDEIIKSSQADVGCKHHLQPIAIEQPIEPDRLHGCNRLQTVLATEKSLNGNGKSPPVARLHGFSGETGRACAGPGAETFPPVCVHCGTPATADTPVQIYAIDGEEYPLHRDCQTDWLKEENQ